VAHDAAGSMRGAEDVTALFSTRAPFHLNDRRDAVGRLACLFRLARG
jgi:hypothetical protein